MQSFLELPRTAKILYDSIHNQARLLDLIFEHSLDSIVLLDKDYNFIKVSETYAKACQRDASEFPEHNHFEFYPSKLEQELEEYRINKKIYKRNARPFVFPDHPEWGITYWDLGMVPILDEEGEIEFFLFTLKDVTKRIRTEDALRESEARYRKIVETAYEGIWTIDADNCTTFVNKKMAEMLGYTVEEMHGRSFFAFMDEEGRRIATRYVERRKLGIAERHEFKFIHKEGNDVWTEVSTNPFFDAEGSYVGALAMIDDITERRKTEESMTMAAAIYQSSAEAIMVTDKDNHIVDVNPAFSRITAYQREEVVGKDAKILQSGRHDRVFYEEMWQKIIYEGSWKGEIWDRRKDGEIYVKWMNISAIRNPNGSVYRYIAQFSDITDKKQKDELIWKQANYDMLTGLPNRRLFHDRLEQELKKVHRASLPLALLFIDLDRFKEINDTMGHAKGDFILMEAARRIEVCVRETDTISRLGGDEFTAILPNFGDRQQIERIAQHIIEELSKPFYFKDDVSGYYISASIGITLYPDDAENIDGLLKNADQAMYRAKEEGRQRFSYFTESMQLEAREKLALTHHLRQSLERHELHVFYQPIVEIATSRIVKAEALLRWVHPVRGMVNPTSFIPLAEESGLIHKIGELVFQEVITSVERWRKIFGCIVPVSVNKSPVQFEYNPNDATWLDRLKSLGLPGNSVTVEITEGILLKESPKTKEKLAEYRNTGIEVSIDDFGTGFSALSYLKKFDIDYLKVDRSFINKLTEDESDMALTEAIVVMAHKLGIQTIAEGVETEEQRDLLASFGCDHAQGFLYSPAVPTEEFEKMFMASIRDRTNGTFA